MLFALVLANVAQVNLRFYAVLHINGQIQAVLALRPGDLGRKVLCCHNVEAALCTQASPQAPCKHQTQALDAPVQPLQVSRTGSTRL